ncbi:MAG: hypothetical protein HYY09_03390, partial [Firmicutes bacterium]|nr:hypothetical protein [Bacillota bacterium]
MRVMEVRPVRRLKRVKLIVPVITSAWNDSLKRSFLEHVRPGLEVEVVNLDRGPASI